MKRFALAFRALVPQAESHPLEEAKNEVRSLLYNADFLRKDEPVFTSFRR